MVDTNRLRGVMAERKKTQSDVAKFLGITPKTFYLKMKKGVFNSDELFSMIQYLKIENPDTIFFV